MQVVPKQTEFTPYRRGMIRWVGYIRSEGMTLWPRSHHFSRWATWQLCVGSTRRDASNKRTPGSATYEIYTLISTVSFQG